MVDAATAVATPVVTRMNRYEEKQKR